MSQRERPRGTQGRGTLTQGNRYIQPFEDQYNEDVPRRGTPANPDVSRPSQGQPQRQILARDIDFGGGGGSSHTAYENERPQLRLPSKTKKILILTLLIVAIAHPLTNNLRDSLTYHSAPPIVYTLPDPVPYVPSRTFDMDFPNVAELVLLIDYYPSAAIIAENIHRIPTRMVEMALQYPETMDFVAGYLNYGVSRRSINAGDIDISGDFTPGIIPHFIQWDKRWGYSSHGPTNMGISGCGPTTLSMVAVGLTGNTLYNPRFVADFSQANGFIAPSGASEWRLMSEGAQAFGLEARELILDANTIRAALNRGEPVVAVMGPGDFTNGGHFILLLGIAENGDIRILDSNSNANSARTWELGRLMSQMRNLWAFTVAG